MRLEQLEYLVTVAETKSMTIASNLLYVSHQNISKSLLGLEKELGIQLLNRTNKGVSLTEKGEKIAQYAKQMLNIQDAIYKLAKKDGSITVKNTEQINILLTNGFSKKVSIVQSSFEKQFPNLLPFIQEAEPSSILSDLLADNLTEFPIIFTVIETDELKQYYNQLKKKYNIFLLKQSRIVAIASKIMGLDTNKVYTMEEINNLPFLFYQSTINQTNFFFQALSRRGFTKSNCRFPGTSQICATSLKNGTAALFVLDSLMESYYDDLPPCDTLLFTPKILVDNLILLRKDASATAHAFVEYFLHVYQF